MKISAKTEYACIAMLELAARFQSTGPVRVRDLAAAHGIPARFLVQILLQMKAAGLVSSTRGAAGGYQLTRSPEQIRLADVMTVIEGPVVDPAMNVSADTPITRVLQSTWCEATNAQQQVLSSVTFADLLEHSQDTGEMMYYI
jgi:Rrf2 family protein